jgi:MFS transporter, ACS family, pantothenate transporter
MASKEESSTQAKAVGEATASSTSTSSATDSLKPWEKPGIIGGLRRGHRAFQRYAWDDPDMPPAEKWFLFKLDIFLLTTACLGYFSKNLDQSNVSNAFVSGVGQALITLFDQSSLIG